MKKTVLGLMVAIFALVGSTAQAAPIVSQFTTFGASPTSTFNGTPISSGIPNTDVAMTTSQDVFLALTDHQRFANVAPTNDGAGNFFAPVGNDAAQGQPGYTQDNFGWDADVAVAGLLAMYYDSDQVMTDDANWQQVFSLLVGPGRYSNSWNPGMVFLPEGTNPNLPNVTSVMLQFTPIGGQMSTVSINTFRGTQPPAAVPEPASMFLLGSGLVGIVARARRRRTGK